ncbi:MAG: hypothetical protein Q7R81_08010 [Candidatus Peregrinibacteria bacterium]|nr:hypothetical protein [Candidatus Peregrinibacteria bacterium]
MAKNKRERVQDTGRRVRPAAVREAEARRVLEAIEARRVINEMKNKLRVLRRNL